MRITLLCTLLASAYLSSPSFAGPAPYHIVGPRRPLSAGEKVELKIDPPLPAIDIHWALPLAAGCPIQATASYHAPYVISPAVTSTFARVSLPTGRDSIEIRLLPSSVPGAAGCLGPGQSFSTEYGDLAHDTHSVIFPVSPIVIRSTDPRYPRNAVVRGLADTLVVRTLVCRTGEPLDAFIQPYCDDRLNAIPFDPVLGDAAVRAVMEAMFDPPHDSTGPIAGWMYNFVIFRP